MKHQTLFLPSLLLIAFSTHSVFGACSRANLTQCLDSACAINISSNPTARCQYCGTSSAGTPSNKNVMRSLSLGMSTKYILSDKELKNAPSDPGQRYAWATAECIKKVSGCTTDDVSETYDSLIEQSCKAAGITAEMSKLQKDLTKTVSKTDCTNQVQACLIADSKCGPDFRACKTDSDFYKFFAACGVEATGCDSYISEIRTAMLTYRDEYIANSEAVINNIVTAYQEARNKKLADAEAGCKNNSARESCIKTVCERNMPNKCESESEKAMATQLCKFYDTACGLLK